MQNSAQLEIAVTLDEAARLRDLGRRTLNEIEDSADADWIDIVIVAAGEIPHRLRSEVYCFKRAEKWAWLVLRGAPIDVNLLPPTPLRVGEEINSAESRRALVVYCLFGALLGEPFGWSGHQNGRIVTDILPEMDKRHQLSGSGSSRKFDFHTEDAFHPCAPDYLGLMCLRNPDRVPTLLSALAEARLDTETIEILRSPRYLIGANVAQDVEQPREPSSVLFGDREMPYMRVNLNHQRAVERDTDAARALDLLRLELVRHRREVVLEPSDLLFVDNYRAAHGRPAFQPRFDGSDRWIKRLFIAASLRSSREHRQNNGRIVASA